MNKYQGLVTPGFVSILLVLGTVGVVLINSQSIRLDESQSIWMASKSLREMMKLTGEDVHVPLYNTLLHFVIQFFGIDVATARYLSLGLFLVSIPVLYRLCIESSNSKVALISSALYSFSPFIIWYSTEARMYSLLLLVTLVNHLFFLRMMRSKGESGKLGYFLASVSGVFTHYFFWLVLLSQGVYLFVLMSQRLLHKKVDVAYDLDNKFPKEVFYYYMVALGGVILMFLPWLAYVGSLGGASNTQPRIPAPSSYNVILTFVQFVFGFQGGGIQNILVSLWPLAVIILFIAFTKKKKVANDAILYFFITSFLPVLVIFWASYIRPLFLPRYLIFVTPGLFVLLAWILASQKMMVVRFFIMITVAMMSGFLLNQAVSAATPVREDYAALTDYLEENSEATDVIAVSAPFTIYPIEYQYRGEARLATIPEWNRYVTGPIPEFSEELLREQMERYQKVYQNIVVVLSYDQGYEETIEQYMDLNYERLDIQQFPAQIEARKYRLRY